MPETFSVESSASFVICQKKNTSESISGLRSIKRKLPLFFKCFHFETISLRNKRLCGVKLEKHIWVTWQWWSNFQQVFNISGEPFEKIITASSRLETLLTRKGDISKNFAKSEEKNSLLF